MQMKIRELRIPIVLTALILVVTTYWAWQTWSHLDNRGIGREQHEALKMSNIFVGVLSELGTHDKHNLKELEAVLAPVLRASPYQFFLLLYNTQPLLRLGSVPAELVAYSGNTVYFLEDTFVFSRKVSLPLDLAGEHSPPSEGGIGQGEMQGDFVLVLGKDVGDDHMPTGKFIEHVIVPFMAVLLLLVANAASWVMVLRNRSLFEQLEIERTRSSYLEDLGLAAAGLAHETKNPLGIISGIAQQVARDPEIPEKSREQLEAIVDEIDKSVSRLGLFMTFAGKRHLEVNSLNGRRLIEEIATILEPECTAAEVEFSLECDTLTILADEEMLRQVLVNLILNSLAASSSGGLITIRLHQDGTTARIEVADQGEGISPELLSKIFKPYVSGNPEGHGLGLSIVNRFVEDHGWSIAAASEVGQGTVMTITGIPLA